MSGFKDGLEAAASFIEQNELVHTADGEEPRPRRDGNRAGLGYATGIRALPEPHIALVEKIAKMRSREELAAMGFPSLPSEGLHAALDEIIQQARALVQGRASA